MPVCKSNDSDKISRNMRGRVNETWDGSVQKWWKMAFCKFTLLGDKLVTFQTNSSIIKQQAWPEISRNCAQISCKSEFYFRNQQVLRSSDLV